MIRFHDKGSGFDISDDAILNLENGKEFFLDELKTKKLIGFGGEDITYDFLDGVGTDSINTRESITSRFSGFRIFGKKK